MDQDMYDEYIEQEYEQTELDSVVSNNSHYQQKQQIGVKFLRQDEVFDSLNKQIHETQEMISHYNDDSIIEILHYFRWNMDKLNEQYFKSNKDQENLQRLFLEKGFIKKEMKIQTQINKICQVCLNHFSANNPSITIQCGHEFCQYCWIEHSREKIIYEKNPFIICMQFQCQMTLPYSGISKLIQSDQKLLSELQKCICRKYIEENPNMAWCPGVDCKFCVFADSSCKDIYCQCGQVFCFKCRDEIHIPTPCDMVQKWLQEVKKDEANVRWIMINTKMCPFCKRNVERSEGCNFMSCKPPGGCGNSFCYVCSKPWEPDHKDHFKCSVYQPDQDSLKQVSKEKEVLQKYNFFYERYLNSEGAKKKSIERKQNLRNIIQQIFDYIKVTYHDSQFLEDAVDELINARQVLKWYIFNLCVWDRSYCFGYFISESDKRSGDLFVHYQSQFESVCEKLAINLMKLFDFIDTIDRTKGRGRLAHDMFQKFSEYKYVIQTHVGSCKKFKQNLIENINSGEIFLSK